MPRLTNIPSEIRERIYDFVEPANVARLRASTRGLRDDTTRELRHLLRFMRMLEGATDVRPRPAGAAAADVYLWQGRTIKVRGEDMYTEAILKFDSYDNGWVAELERRRPHFESRYESELSTERAFRMVRSWFAEVPIISIRVEKTEGWDVTPRRTHAA